MQKYIEKPGEQIRVGDWYKDTCYTKEGEFVIKQCARIEGEWIIPTKETDTGDGEAHKAFCIKIQPI